MSKIFVSYRRSDSQDVAGRIVDRLIGHFGEDSVFVDVDSIPFGADFRDHIQSVLSHAAAVVAIVGPDWLGAKATQHPRIDEPDDPVRVEIETALRQKLPVIPVLVGSASMPSANSLPGSLQAFAFLNAAAVHSGRDFRVHADRLIRALEAASQAKADHSAKREAISPIALGRSHATPLWVAAAVVLLLLGGGAAAWRLGAWQSHTPMVGSPPATAALSPPPDATTARGGSAVAPTAIAALPQPNPPTTDPSDEGDWNAARRANSYEAYQAYAARHPYGRHTGDARAAALAVALQAEPPIGQLPTGETVLVDDHACGVTDIKVVTGGDVTKGVTRIRKCISRDQPF